MTGGSTAKGRRTRSRLLTAAEKVFGSQGYYEAKLSDITDAAGVALGTFYGHFSGKKEIFDELLRTRGEELREVVRSASKRVGGRGEAEAASLRAYFEWISEHADVYRAARQASAMDPVVIRDWFDTVTQDYARDLERSMEAGEIVRADPTVLAYMLFGMADFIAMRYLVWPDERALDDSVLQEVIAGASRVLGVRSERTVVFSAP